MHGDDNIGSYNILLITYNGDKPKNNLQNINLNSGIHVSIGKANQLSVIQNSFTLIYSYTAPNSD